MPPHKQSFSPTPDWGKRDQEILWHPFTQQQEWCSRDPLVIVGGKGAILYDKDGKAYFDGNSSIWTNIHGHAHPHIVSAIARQAATLDHTSFLGTTHPTAVELGERLLTFFESTPLKRVFYSDNGSTAIEAALKMAVQYWQQTGHPERFRFVSFSNCYHGDTTGASSLGGVSLFTDRFAKMHFPNTIVANLEELTSLSDKETIAAIVIEPMIQGVAGMRPWPAGMLQQLRHFCDQHHILLIFDEVMTGFGRTGKMFACQHENVTPDFLALAKGITGGTLPLAATLTTTPIYEAFLGKPSEQKTFYYGHSYTANPIACSAAMASLEIFERENVLANLPPKITALTKTLQTLSEHPHIGATRQLGMIAGIDIVQEKASSTRYPPTKMVGAALCYAARDHGLLTRPIGDTIVLMPPLCSTTTQVERAGKALLEAIENSQLIN